MLENLYLQELVRVSEPEQDLIFDRLGESFLRKGEGSESTSINIVTDKWRNRNWDVSRSWCRGAQISGVPPTKTDGALARDERLELWKSWMQQKLISWDLSIAKRDLTRHAYRPQKGYPKHEICSQPASACKNNHAWLFLFQIIDITKVRKVNVFFFSCYEIILVTRNRIYHWEVN